jgi:hypothetical protein
MESTVLVLIPWSLEKVGPLKKKQKWNSVKWYPVTKKVKLGKKK